MTTPHNYPVPDRIRVPQPAAGANFSFTNSDGGLLVIRSVSFVFTTSAVVGTRIVGLQISYDGDVVVATSTGLGQTETHARPYSAFSSGSSAAISPTGVALPWRDNGVLVRQGAVLFSVTDGFDVGDQYSAIVLDVLRYLPDYPYAAQPYREGYNIETGS